MQETEKLYELDSMLRSCRAVILSCEQDKEGYAVILDRTVIFPEGGGQLSDAGHIDEALVTHAAERDGQVVHYCRQPFAVGSEVLVKLDWPIRLDHMQQHAGEHLLSHAFWQICGANNVGFHMSRQSVSIDLDKEVTAEEIMQAEEFANEQIWANKPITVNYLPSEKLDAAEMRKKNEKLEGLLRVVTVEGGDSCTCCGTHPPFTGMIGSIKVIGQERHKNGVRVEFVCGKRALADARCKNEAIAQAKALLSVKPEEVPLAVKKLKDEIAVLAGRLKDKSLALFELRVDSLLEKAFVNKDGLRVVCLAEEDCTANEAKMLAQMLAAQGKVVAGIVYRAGDKVNYVFASSEAGSDCREYCKQASALFDGKGGGRADFAQGGGVYSEDWRIKLKELEKTL